MRTEPWGVPAGSSPRADTLRSDDRVAEETAATLVRVANALGVDPGELVRELNRRSPSRSVCGSGSRAAVRGRRAAAQARRRPPPEGSCSRRHSAPSARRRQRSPSPCPRRGTSSRRRRTDAGAMGGGGRSRGVLTMCCEAFPALGPRLRPNAWSRSRASAEAPPDRTLARWQPPGRQVRLRTGPHRPPARPARNPRRGLPCGPPGGAPRGNCRSPASSAETPDSRLLFVCSAGSMGISRRKRTRTGIAR